MQLFKADPELAVRHILPLFVKIWKKKILDDWCKGTIVKIPKRGIYTNCNNWRGITLLSVPSKIFCKIIIKWLSTAVDKVLRKEQAGFRKGRGGIDHIFTLGNIIKQCTEWQSINFVQSSLVITRWSESTTLDRAVCEMR